MLHERALLQNGCLLEVLFRSASEFRLSLRCGDALLVEYSSGARMVKGRRSGYAFKSVEKLRYDFENDVRDAQPPG